LSLDRIEELIYQRDCIKFLVEKTFESLKQMTEKLIHLEKELQINNSSNQQNSSESPKENGKNLSLQTDNQKLKDLLSIQLSHSENFRQNTEKTLNRIKEEFQHMVSELDVIRKKTSKHQKGVKSMDFNNQFTSTFTPNINSGGKSNKQSKQNENKKVPTLKLNK
jgi:hypothetical protein